MSNSDDDDKAIAKVMLFLKNSEFGSEDYHLGYKTLVKLLKEQIDIYWMNAQKDFTNKQEFLFLSIVDGLIDINVENEESLNETPEVISKIIKADSELLEYCKALSGMENSYSYPLKFKVDNNLDLIRQAIKIS